MGIRRTAAAKRVGGLDTGKGRMVGARQEAQPAATDVSGPVVHAIDGGVLIDVRVIPRAGRSGIAGTRDGALLVRLAAPPVDGAANAELIDVLATALGVAKRAVTLVAGERSRQKRVGVAGISEREARSRLSLTAG
jgi:uncharacterized protein (TIGR00251 family)